MGMTCGHNNGFALVQLIRLAVYCNSARFVKAGDKCVAAGGMCAYFFVLIKRKKGYGKSVVLRKGFAHNLSVLISNLLFKSKDLCFVNIFKNSFIKKSTPLSLVYHPLCKSTMQRIKNKISEKIFENAIDCYAA